MNKWDFRFLTLARHIADWSRDPSTQVGAVIARPNKSIASLGFNGFPQGIADTEVRLRSPPIKYALVKHAEINALHFCQDQDLDGYTIYTWPFRPCPQCAGDIIQRGIKRVVTLSYTPARYAEAFELSALILAEANVELELFDELA